MKLVNTRADLEALRGTPAFADALRAIAGAASIVVDAAEYPQGYGLPGHDGPPVEPVWEERADDAVLSRLEMTRDELAAQLAAHAPPPP